MHLLILFDKKIFGCAARKNSDTSVPPNHIASLSLNLQWKVTNFQHSLFIHSFIFSTGIYLHEAQYMIHQVPWRGLHKWERLLHGSYPDISSTWMQKDGSFVSCVPLASPPHYLLLESTSSLQSPFTLWHTVHHTVDMLEVRSIQNVETKKN